MTKLEAVLERIRQLPQDQQDAIAIDLEQMLDEEPDYLTLEQRTELNRRLADPNRQYISHEEVLAEFEEKYGR